MLIILQLLYKTNTKIIYDYIRDYYEISLSIFIYYHAKYKYYYKHILYYIILYYSY